MQVYDPAKRKIHGLKGQVLTLQCIGETELLSNSQTQEASLPLSQEKEELAIKKTERQEIRNTVQSCQRQKDWILCDTAGRRRWAGCEHKSKEDQEPYSYH